MSARRSFISLLLPTLVPPDPTGWNVSLGMRDAQRGVYEIHMTRVTTEVEAFRLVEEPWDALGAEFPKSGMVIAREDTDDAPVVRFGVVRERGTRPPVEIVDDSWMRIPDQLERDSGLYEHRGYLKEHPINWWSQARDFRSSALKMGLAAYAGVRPRVLVRRLTRALNARYGVYGSMHEPVFEEGLRALVSWLEDPKSVRLDEHSERVKVAMVEHNRLWKKSATEAEAFRESTLKTACERLRMLLDYAVSGHPYAVCSMMRYSDVTPVPPGGPEVMFAMWTRAWRYR